MNGPVDHFVALTSPQAVDTTAVKIWAPEAADRAVVIVLGHGAGSALDEHVISTLAGGLATRGVTAATFNFGYRQAGRRIPDRMDRLRSVFCDVAAEVVRLWSADPADPAQPADPARAARLRPSTRSGPDVEPGAATPTAPRLVLGGRSLGGRVATLLVADGRGDAAVALGYPLCPRGRPVDDRRTAHWPRVTAPILFVHGDRDRLCPVAALDEARARHLTAAPHRAHVVAGADHSFEVRKRDLRSRDDIDRELLDVVDRWLRHDVERDRAPVQPRGIEPALGCEETRSGEEARIGEDTRSRNETRIGEGTHDG